MRTFQRISFIALLALATVAQAKNDICDLLEGVAKENPNRLTQLKQNCRANSQAADPAPVVTEVEYLDNHQKADFILLSVTSYNSGSKGNRFCEVSFIDGRGSTIERNVIVEPDGSTHMTDKNGIEIPVTIDTAPQGNPLFRLAMGSGRADERNKPSTETSSACYVAQRLYRGEVGSAKPPGAIPQ